jgi:hypothetical protein
LVCAAAPRAPETASNATMTPATLNMKAIIV